MKMSKYSLFWWIIPINHRSLKSEMGFALDPKWVKKSVIYSEQGVYAQTNDNALQCTELLIINSYCKAHDAEPLKQALYIHRANDHKPKHLKNFNKTYWVYQTCAALYGFICIYIQNCILANSCIFKDSNQFYKFLPICLFLMAKVV